MIEVARVVSVNRNRAIVQIMNEESCGTGCASCKGCSVVSPTHVEAENTIGAKVGQIVRIERNSNAYLKSLILVFVLPVVLLFIGVGFGYRISALTGFSIYKDWFGVVSGIAFWGISFLIVRLIDKRVKLASRVEFKIVGYRK